MITEHNIEQMKDKAKAIIDNKIDAVKRNAKENNYITPAIATKEYVKFSTSFQNALILTTAYYDIELISPKECQLYFEAIEDIMNNYQ